MPLRTIVSSAAIYAYYKGSERMSAGTRVSVRLRGLA
jgi:hypothetical protein